MEQLMRKGKKVYSTVIHLRQKRFFIRARIRWVKDEELDNVVAREKNLKPLIFIQDLILSSPHGCLPISTIAAATSALNLPSSAVSFLLLYPSFFHPLPRRRSFSLTAAALSLHRRHSSLPAMAAAAENLSKLLMLGGAGGRLPFSIVDHLKYDMGLPHNYALTLLSHFPDYFSVTGSGDGLCVELVRNREEVAVSWMQREGISAFPMRLPKGFDLKKKVVDWMEMWQGLPYISPYENGFHLTGRGDQAEKWVVGVLHELLHLCVGKKVEKGVVLNLGRYLGFGRMFEKVFAHYPGIFYTCNKIRTQTVVLRECYEEETLLHAHPLVAVRYSYVDLMNESCKKMVHVM